MQKTGVLLFQEAQMGMENKSGGNNNTAENLELGCAKNVEDLIRFAHKAEKCFRQQFGKDGVVFRRYNERIRSVFGSKCSMLEHTPIPETLPTPLWFRGQPLKGEGLIPKCRRQKYKPIAQDENNALVTFMLGAHARSAEVLPNADDYAGWLALAQHYGLPTRLLDWSASILVAAFFASQKSDKEDGIIYSTSPALINSEFGEYIGPSQLLMEAKNTSVNILHERFNILHKDGRDKAVAYAKKCLEQNQLTEKEIQQVRGTLLKGEVTELIAAAYGAPHSYNSKKILALGPRQMTRRIMQQLGFFTIHGSASEPLEKAPNHNYFLLEITIPATEKNNIRNQLRYLGITRSYLFPDLDNLAREITNDLTSNLYPD